MRKPFSSNSSYFIERRIFAKNYKFSNKTDDHVFAWRDFKKNLCDVYIIYMVNGKTRQKC